MNVDTLPWWRGGGKNRELAAFCASHKVEVMGLAETNRCWHLLDPADRIPERFRGWWESQHATVAYNTCDPHANQFQRGGVALLSINQAAHRVCGAGRDPSGLGRWAWTRYMGRGGATVRVTVAYRPVLSEGPFTVYSQQRRFLNDRDDDRCP